MRIGERITVVDFFGNQLDRRVVETDEEYVFVCNEAEWNASRSEKREPTCIGFRLEYVVSASTLSRHPHCTKSRASVSSA